MKYSEMPSDFPSGRIGTLRVTENMSFPHLHNGLELQLNSQRIHCTKSYDAVVFSILQVAPEDLASQLTLMDVQVFSRIQPDELTSCEWNKRDKLKLAPNVVSFTQRFNHVCFWTVKEILQAQLIKNRADTIAHFIKVAKRLHELNNLHAEFAIISALQSTPIFRLSKTWGQVSKKDKGTYEKLAETFSDNNNFEKLREHMGSLRLPCIPYLGLFLTDLVFIDIAHPPTQGLDNQQRQMKMNNILRVIADYQRSSYDHLPVLPHVQNYLKSVKYIEELQKFVEEENYSQSLKLEPPDDSGNTRDNFSPEKKVPGYSRSLLCSSGNLCARSSKSMPGYSCSKFVPGHRKSYSLGSNVYSSCSVEHLSSTKLKGRHLLDDSLLEDNSPLTTRKRSSTCQEIQGCNYYRQNSSPLPKAITSPESILSNIYTITFESCVRRKTILKDGRKPAISSWTRYWLVLKGTVLYYYPPRSLRGTEQCDFKGTPSKSVDISGWLVVCSENPHRPDCFQLTDTVKGNVYKFRAGSQSKAYQWYKYLSETTKQDQDFKHSVNLMSFE